MNLSELFATWQTWNERNVVEQAARRAEQAGRDEDAAELRRGLAEDEAASSAVEALAAQHELTELLGGWRWHTVTAAREQGATWTDVAAATGTDPTTARDAFRDQVAAAEHAAETYGIPFRDAERYRAAARDDTDTPAPLHSRADEENPAMTDQDDLRVEHISGPDPYDDGLVVGEIALPGGLPPDEDEEDDDGQRWDDAFEIADRNGYVVFDPATPGGFRALTSDERTQLTDAARAGQPTATGRAQDWWESDTGREHVRQWAVDTADPDKAAQAGPVDDPAALEQRLDDLRVRLTGYTWREGVDRDEAFADRREQLGRWYDDDHAERDTAVEHDDDGSGMSQIECGPDVGRTT